MVNLNKYIGKWYEIASFPAWFQRGCSEITAEYTIKDNYIEVKNSCNKNGKRKTQVGKAFLTDKPDLLKVQFFAPFKGDYKIEYVDDNYEYAIVGNDKKNYLWILARKPKITTKQYKELLKIAYLKGYDINKLKRH